MFSYSVVGGSICLRCQVRAVTRRATPLISAAQVRRRRQYASEATKQQEMELEKILIESKHDESTQHSSTSTSNWGGWDEVQLPDPKSARKDQSPAAQMELEKILIESRHDESTQHASTSTSNWGGWDEVQLPDPKSARKDQSPAAPDGNSRDETDVLHGMGGETQTKQIFQGTVDGRRPFKDRATRFREALEGRTRTEARPVKRKYKRGALKLVEESFPLAVDTMGKPGEVLILREGGEWKKNGFPVEAAPLDQAESGLDAKDFLDQEEGIGLDIILENIEGLRPRYRIISAREFKSIYDGLLQGFTAVQLESYVERHHLQLLEKDETTAPGSRPKRSAKQRSYRWIVHQAQWVPEVKDAVEDVDCHLQGYIMKSMPPKQRLVMQLMRECWDVSIQELLDGNGRLDIQVRDLEFKLLTLGTQRWLQKISRIYLKQGKQIEIIRSQNLIRIVAPKAVAESCLKAINETLEMSKTQSFRTKKLRLPVLDNGMLEDVANVTNSIVQFSDEGKKIQVTWLHIRNSDSEAELENLADVVFRLLLTSHTAGATNNTLTVYPEVEGQGRFIEDLGNKDKFSWADRRKEWARLCLPLSAAKPSVAKAWPLTTDALKYKIRPSPEDLILPKSEYREKAREKDNERYQSLEGKPLALPWTEKAKPADQQPKQVWGPEPTKPTPSGWLPFRVSTNAVFGHVLHPHNNAAVLQAINRGFKSLVDFPRILSPLIPPVSKMKLPGWVPYNKDATSTVLMRFIPYSDKKPSQPSQAPVLELRLGADEEEILGIHSLRAVAEVGVSDILLPAEYVDIRATQRVYAELPGSMLDTTDGMAPLLSFVHSSILEPGKGRLVTPPRVHDLGLPEWLVNSKSNGMATSSPSRRGAKSAIVAEKTTTTTPDGTTAGSISKTLLPNPNSTLATSIKDSYHDSSNTLTPVSYIFTGLEVHRPLETTYDGWKLVYTSIEAGQGGGRRAELSLEAVPGYDKKLRRGKEAINTTFFLRSIYQLARGLEGHVIRTDDGEEVTTSIAWVGDHVKRS